MTGKAILPTPCMSVLMPHGLGITESKVKGEGLAGASQLEWELHGPLPHVAAGGAKRPRHMKETFSVLRHSNASENGLRKATFLTVHKCGYL